MDDTFIIELMMGYANDNKMTTYELFVVVVEVIKLMKNIAAENMKKGDS
jgi:hypothetical protein